MDLSRLSDSELEAISTGNMKSVSDSTLNYIASGGKGTFKQVQGNPDASPTQVRQMQREFILSQGGLKDRVKQYARDAVPYIRPTVEGLGAAGGAIVGAAGGAAAGLGVGSIPGGMAGGVIGSGLGYGMAKNVMDTVEGNWAQSPQESITRAVSDVGTGAMFEMGGASAGKIITKGIETAPSVIRAFRNPIDTIAKTRAAKTFDLNAALTERETANLAKSQQLLDRLNRTPATGGWGQSALSPVREPVQLTPAQMTGKPAQATLEQNLAMNDPTFSATLGAQDSAAKQTALDRIRQGIGPARPIPMTQDLQTTGANVVESVQAAQAQAKPIHEALYDAIPNTPQPTGKIQAAIKQLKKDFRAGDEDVFPLRAIARVEEALQGPKPSTGGHGQPAPIQILDAQGIPIRQNLDMTKTEVGFQDLHSLRKDIGRQIKDASTGMNPNRELAMKLQTIKGAIDDTIEGSMGADNSYTAAKSAFQEYAGKFRTGSVDKVLTKGNELNGLKLTDEKAAQQFFTPSGVDGLINSIGAPAAKQQMQPFILADMTKAASPNGETFSIQSGITYINKNKDQLDKLGLMADAKQLLKSQFPAEMETILAKTAPDGMGNQLFTPQQMRTALAKYGRTIKTLYGEETLQSFRDYSDLMGMIDRKNLVSRAGNSTSTEKAVNLANSMIKDAAGPAANLTDRLAIAVGAGATAGGGAGLLSGHGVGTAAIGGVLGGGAQLFKNANKQAAQTFVKIMQDGVTNPQTAKALMELQRTGEIPLYLQSIIKSHSLSATGAGLLSGGN